MKENHLFSRNRYHHLNLDQFRLRSQYRTLSLPENRETRRRKINCRPYAAFLADTRQ
ncbi:hypothetical protein [Methanosarcina sp. KYL-1]|uniref:hypothetical protein n=1 Tax=Methanosarcina sp. KYL-1 TaxID=2602068 RepID=UPI002100CF3C|nr:hypothetical protein [Methanosarcina sp. KYL-1]